jgi:tRNA-2-methylthio-N6-dimethylallyladenosine synthase
LRRQPAVDLVVGPQSYHRLPEMEAKIRRGETALDTDFPQEDKFEHLKARPKARRAPAAFLTVQEGCDKFCAFCVFPYTRGAEVSRPAARVLEEARDLVERGVREVTLLGQNVNAYHGAGPKGDMTLAGLIRELAKVDGLERIRYTTSHPNDMDDALIAAHAEVPELMPYLHLPVQSGSDHILKRMNRNHTAESYLRVIERIRAARPDIVLSGDFIVGFPEESDADFDATMDLVREVKYGYAYSFKYSTRPGTPAAERALVDPAVANDRLQRLQALITTHQREIQGSMVGRDVSVLVERKGREPGQMLGKSEYLHAVHIDQAQAEVGDIVQVRIVEALTNSLTARHR